MGWIRTIDRADAEGELRAVYEAMTSRPIPAVYRLPDGKSPGIHLAHSLDPELVRVVFSATGAMHAGEGLGWAERELVASVSARLNQCLY